MNALANWTAPTGIDPRPWTPNPALRDPVQALWSELRFASRPLDRFELVMGAARFLAGPHRIDLRPLSRWVAAGFVAAIGKPLRYSLERKYSTMASPPPMPAPARPIPLPRRSQRQRLWSAMRVLGAFDLTTLLIAAEATRGGAMDMIRILERGGWLRPTQSGWTTAGGRVWGPVAPTWTRYAIGTAPVIRITDQRDGSIVDIPGRARPRADRRPDSSTDVLAGGGVG